jgi:WD40 repeat protein
MIPNEAEADTSKARNNTPLILEGHQGAVMSVAFSPDGKTIASGSWDNTIRLWNLDGMPIGQPFTGHEGYVMSVAFSPDGKTIATVWGDRCRPPPSCKPVSRQTCEKFDSPVRLFLSHEKYP